MCKNYLEIQNQIFFIISYSIYCKQKTNYLLQTLKRTMNCKYSLKKNIKFSNLTLEFILFIIYLFFDQLKKIIAFILTRKYVIWELFVE